MFGKYLYLAQVFHGNHPIGHKQIYLVTRQDREKRTVAAMVGIYCRGNCKSDARQGKGKGELCDSCRELLAYAFKRIDCCPMGARKTSCRKCPVHCYRPEMRESIRTVMRYAGPRMMLHHPIMAFRHLWDEYFKR